MTTTLRSERSGVQPDARTTPAAAVPQPTVTVEKTFERCLGCGTKTRVRVNGRPGHHSCWAEAVARMAAQRAEAAPAGEPDGRAAELADSEADPDLERDASPDEVSMFKLLQESIAASRKHPIVRVPKEHRGQEPWSLMIEPMRGEHRYRVAAPAGSRVRSLDRNGSYPSVMGNLHVAVGRLAHTGAVEYASSMAGIYRIPRFEWTEDGIGHPFGEIASLDEETWWVSTPHLRIALRLAKDGRIAAPEVIDSWTGPSATGLFRHFSTEVQNLRLQGREIGTDVYEQVKRKSSIAIRGLWSHTGRSPFWRPDWSISVRAEAAVRHWVRADQAVTAGAQLLKLGNVDEAAFVVPKGAGPKWVPEPYELGTTYGKVKIKGTVTAKEFDGAKR